MTEHFRRGKKDRWLELLLACAGCALLLSVAVPAHSLTPEEIEKGANKSEFIQQKTQERLQQQFEEDRKSASPPTKLEYEAPEVKGIEIDVCVNITEIVISDAPNLTDEAREKIVKTYVGRCLSIRDIQQLLSDITVYYINKGMVTTRAYVRQQDLSTGRLEILVVEGIVERMMLEDGNMKSVSIGNAFPGVGGKVLNLRDFEQGLDQINRLASNRATLDIQPGELPGGSTVVIINEPGRRYRAGITLDNYGAENTGHWQAGATLSLDRPLGWNDFISFTHRTSEPLSESGRKMSEMNSLSYILPYGYNTMSVGYSWSRYETILETPGGFDLKSKGDSNTGFMRLDRTVYRSQQTIGSLSVTLTTKSSKNYLADQLLNVSSRDLTVLDAGWNVTTVLMGGALGLSWGISQGLDAMGALRDQDNMQDWMPRAQFFKMNYGADYMRPFAIGGYDFQWASNLTGQTTDHVLYGSEQITIGGIFTVRGFEESTISGDNGFYLRNDLSVRIPHRKITGSDGYVRPYIALDHGRVYSKVSGVPEGQLTGLALGLSFNIGRGNLDVFTAWPLYAPDFLESETSRVFCMLRMTI